MAEREDEDHILRFDEVVKGNVTRLAAGYHELAQAAFRRPADRWVALKDLQRIKDNVDSGTSGGRIITSEKLEDTAEVGLRACRKL